MGEMIVDKLVQKVSNMLEEIGEVNLLVRRLTPTQETMNRINERMDAMHGVLKQLEDGVTLDETKLEELESQTKSLREGLTTLKKMTEIQAASAHELKEVIDKRWRENLENRKAVFIARIVGIAILLVILVRLIRHS